MKADLDRNVAPAVARGFGQEWSTFRQGEQNLTRQQREAIFENYFSVFPWERLPAEGGVGIDVGCGTGRWSTMVAPRVGHLHLLDVSPEALAVARENLAPFENVSFHVGSVAEIPFPAQSFDFAFSLGVLHHVPDTRAAIRSVAEKLKPGAPFLLYLYYAFDNQPAWYRWLWALSNMARIVVARLPHPARRPISEAIAALIYWPLARLSGLLIRMGMKQQSLPLSWYADKSFYVMRTDAYDRFCTQLEQRFTKAQIGSMLSDAGFDEIVFSNKAPYWCAAGVKSATRTPTTGLA